MHPMKEKFLLDPATTYLNHGSFGACPKDIFEDYQYWQRKLEENPVQFITKLGQQQLDVSRRALADYIRCDEQDIVFMPNPTTALNTVINSLNLQKGDEILSTNQEYGALDRTWKFHCEKTGAKYVHAQISLPLVSKEKFLEEFFAALNPRTKVIFFSHITSSTALIFPAQEICDKARSLGILTIVDGAHVPGHIELDINRLNPDIYTGANHKWLLAPKGNSFLYVRRALQHAIEPLIVSWGYDAIVTGPSQFQDYHQYNGTRDFSAYLTIPACLRFFKENNWEAEKKKCNDQLLHYYPILANELESSMLCPLDAAYLGQICSIPIETTNAEQLKNTLYEKFHIEIPIMQLGAKQLLRVSFQAYNDEKDIEHLINAIREIKKSANLLN